MLGRTHVLSGAAAYNAVTLIPWLDLHPTLTDRAGCTLIAAGAAALCDLDSCGSTAARTFGFGSRLVAHVIRAASRGHREGTHSGVGVAAFTGYTAVALALLTAPIALHWPVQLAAASIQWTAGAALTAILMFIIASALDALHLARHHTADTIAIIAAVALVAGHAYVPGITSIPLAVAIGIAVHIAGDMLTDHGCPLAWPWSEHRYHLTPRWARFATGTWPEHVIAAGLTVANLWFAASATGLAATYLNIRHL